MPQQPSIPRSNSEVCVKRKVPAATCLTSESFCDSPAQHADQLQQLCTAASNCQPSKLHAHGTRPTRAAKSAAGTPGKPNESVSRRMIINRQSAMRSKERQRQYVVGLEQSVKQLTSKLSQHRHHLLSMGLNLKALGEVKRKYCGEVAILQKKARNCQEQLTLSQSECAQLRMTMEQSEALSHPSSDARTSGFATQIEKRGEGATTVDFNGGLPRQFRSEPGVRELPPTDAAIYEHQPHNRLPSSVSPLRQASGQNLPESEDCLWESFVQWDPDSPCAVQSESDASTQIGRGRHNKKQADRSYGRTVPTVASVSLAAYEGSIVPRDTNNGTRQYMALKDGVDAYERQTSTAPEQQHLDTSPAHHGNLQNTLDLSIVPPSANVQIYIAGNSMVTQSRPVQ